jgi:hypothetical protein
MTVVRAGPTSASSAKNTRKASALHTTPSTATAAQAAAPTFPTLAGPRDHTNGA